MFSMPTFDEYRAATEVINAYHAGSEQIIQGAILDGRVRAVTEPERAWNALVEYFDSREPGNPFTSASVHAEVPITKRIHGKTIAAAARRRRDIKQVGFTKEGLTCFDRISLPRRGE